MCTNLHDYLLVFRFHFGRGVSSTCGGAFGKICRFALDELRTSSSTEDVCSLMTSVASWTVLELGLLLHPPLCRTLPKNSQVGQC